MRIYRCPYLFVIRISLLSLLPYNGGLQMMFMFFESNFLKNFKVAHVHTLDYDSQNSVYDMSKQKHAFIIKGFVSIETLYRA